MSTLSTRFRSANNVYSPPRKKRQPQDWREHELKIFRGQLHDFSTDQAYSPDDVDFLSKLEHNIHILESELEDIRSGLFQDATN